jgi:hypothetical protein
MNDCAGEGQQQIIVLLYDDREGSRNLDAHSELIAEILSLVLALKI